MAYNATASMDNLICTNYVDFRKCRDKTFVPKTIPTTSLWVSKVSKENDNEEFRLDKILQWVREISTS